MNRIRLVRAFGLALIDSVRPSLTAVALIVDTNYRTRRLDLHWNA